jgi:branched-chain amino acid transport system permease protein
VLASLSGWLYAHFLRFVNPTPFNISAGVEYLFMAVVGGATFLSGAIVGSAVLVLLKELLQEVLPGLIGTAGNYELIAFGVIMILLLQRTHQGIMNAISPLLPPLARGWDAPAEVAELPVRPLPAAGKPLLLVEHITKKFGGLIAVDDLSFTLYAGEIVGLVGPNGAGKSTTFAVISGTLGPTSGSVRLLDDDISASSSRRIAQLGVARTFQHVRLLPEMTVLDNVMLGMHLRGSCGLLSGALHLDRGEEACLRAEAMRQIERAGLSGYANERAGNLSMGHQRLVEVARALAADPILLLVDEPAAGLRQFEKDALSALFAQVRKDGISIVLVEHDMDFLMNLADRLVVIDFGRKIAEGRPDEVSRHPDVLEAYLGGIYDDEECAA